MVEIGAFLALIIFGFVGFIAIFFTTFGTFLILIGVLIYSFLTNFTVLTLQPLLIIFALYILGEVVEFAFTALGVKKFGASNWAIAGAIGGGILGAGAGALFMGIGAIPGTFIGIFAGAFLVELFIQKDFWRSFKAGTGGVIGRIGSIVFKVFIAIAIFGIVVTKMMATSRFPQ